MTTETNDSKHGEPAAHKAAEAAYEIWERVEPLLDEMLELVTIAQRKHEQEFPGEYAQDMLVELHRIQEGAELVQEGIDAFDYAMFGR